MTIFELIKYSANDVKTNKHLFAEFLRLYEEENGKKPNCASCVFASTFNKWKFKHTLKNKTKKMGSQKQNTFKLKIETAIYRVPFSTTVITKDSTDKDVLDYIDQDKGRYKDAREKIFLKLPEKPKRKSKTKAK